MARNFLRFLARLDDLLELAVVSLYRFARTRRVAFFTGICLIAAAGVMWSGSHPPDQGLKDGDLVPAMAGPDLDAQLTVLELDENLLSVRPVNIRVDAIVGRHGDHCALVTYQGRSYRARPGTLIPQDGPPAFVVTRVACESVEAYDWMARQTVKADLPKTVPTGLSEVKE